MVVLRRNREEGYANLPLGSDLGIYWADILGKREARFLTLFLLGTAAASIIRYASIPP